MIEAIVGFVVLALQAALTVLTIIGLCSILAFLSWAWRRATQ